MRFRFAVPAALALLIAIPAFAQRPEERHAQEEHRDGPRGNQGHVPQARRPSGILTPSRRSSAMIRVSIQLHTSTTTIGTATTSRTTSAT
jgi:hypothetical protein